MTICAPDNECSDPGSEYCRCHRNAGHREAERIKRAEEDRSSSRALAAIPDGRVPDGAFASFQQWVIKATSWIGGTNPLCPACARPRDEVQAAVSVGPQLHVLDGDGGRLSDEPAVPRPLPGVELHCFAAPRVSRAARARHSERVPIHARQPRFRLEAGLDVANEAHIVNTGLGTARLGRYVVQTLRGRSREQLDQAVVQRCGEVLDWPRQRLHVWNLVAEALASMRYGRGR